MQILCVNRLHSVTPWVTLPKILFGVTPMTSAFHISLIVKTTPQLGADFGVRAGRGGSAGDAMWAGPRVRTVIVEASRNLDALAARSAG